MPYPYLPIEDVAYTRRTDRWGRCIFRCWQRALEIQQIEPLELYAHTSLNTMFSRFFATLRMGNGGRYPAGTIRAIFCVFNTVLSIQMSGWEEIIGVPQSGFSMLTERTFEEACESANAAVELSHYAGGVQRG